MLSAFLSLILLIVVASVAVLAVRAHGTASLTSSCRTFQLRFPRELSPNDAVAYLSGLVGVRPRWWQRVFVTPAVVLEVRGDVSGVAHLIRVPSSWAEYVLGQLRAAIPSIQVEEAAVPGFEAQAVAELRLSRWKARLRVDDPAAVSRSLLACFHPLSANESLCLQIVVTPATVRQEPEFEAERELADALLGRDKHSFRVSRDERIKIAAPLFVCSLRLGASAGSKARARALVRKLRVAFHVADAPQTRLVERLIPSRGVARQLQRAAVPLVHFANLFNAQELAALSGLPIGSPVLPGVSLGGARELPPLSQVQADGRTLGIATFPGGERPIAISEEESLRHVWLGGPTGAGKSTLMMRLITADIAAGRGVMVIDPAGDLVSALLDRIPAERQGDVILVDPSDVERPVGMNLLADVTRSPDLIVDNIVAVFHRVWSRYWGPRSEDVIRSSLLTLIREPGATICELPLLLTDSGYRRRLVGKLDDPIALQPFWSWFSSLNDMRRAEVIGPVSNKLRAFLLRPMLRNILGQSESTFSMEEVLAQRKILLVSLAKGSMGEDAANLCGALFVARFWQAVQARAAMPPEQRTVFFAAIDEFQDVVALPTPVGDVLAQSRKWGVGLLLANQHLSQLDPEVKQGVLSNARTRVMFQTAAADAAALAKEFAPHVSADDLKNLDAFHAYASISVGNRVVPPISIRTLPAPPSLATADQVRNLSRNRYGRDRAGVEAEIRGRYTDRKPNAPVGRKPRKGSTS